MKKQKLYIPRGDKIDGEIYTASPRLPPPPPSLSLSSFPQFKISTIFEIKLTPVIHGSEYTATSEVRRILGRVITKLYIPREDKI